MADMLIFFTIFCIGIFLGFLILDFINKSKKSHSEKETQPVPVKFEDLKDENETLFEKKLILEEAIAVIGKLSENISLSLNLKELGEEIVKTTSRILNVEICALLLLDESKESLTIIASSGIDKDFAQEVSIKKGEEISGLAAKYNDVKIYNNLETETKFDNLKYDTCYKESLISHPLSFKNKVMGVLNVSKKKTGKPFYPIDAEIIKIISLESAIALQDFKLLNEQYKNYLNTIIALANTVDARDPYTYRHSHNVTKYSVRIAQYLQLPTQLIEDIRYAGLLHDIGKIAIKDEILLKTSKLTEEEYAQIKIHSEKGEEIIKSLPFLHEVSKIIRHHHERFDGNGYPDKLKGENIEVGARILAVADSFDAMTTKRTYRNPLSLEKTKEELINNKNSQFDPEIVDCFLQILEKEPNILSQNDT